MGDISREPVLDDASSTRPRSDRGVRGPMELQDRMVAETDLGRAGECEHSESSDSGVGGRLAEEGIEAEVVRTEDRMPISDAEDEPVEADARDEEIESPEADDEPFEDLESDDAPALEDPDEVASVLLAVLLSTKESLSTVRLAEVCNGTQKAVKAGLECLETKLRTAGMPLELIRNGEQVRLLTVPAVFPYLQRLRTIKRAEKLSPAALETLAVVAYRQPVIRAEIEAIRGVKAGPVLRSLLDLKLIKVTGRADVPGRPLQYGTTQLFLERFGLGSLKDLPSIQEFRSLH